jgi:hypothetical protein
VATRARYSVSASRCPRTGARSAFSLDAVYG